jgi:hypothetical protein
MGLVKASSLDLDKNYNIMPFCPARSSGIGPCVLWGLEQFRYDAAWIVTRPPRLSPSGNQPIAGQGVALHRNVGS